MQRMEKVVTSLLIVTAILFILLSSSCKKSPTEKQPQVVLYCSVDQAVAEPIIAQFEKQSGIKVLARFDTEASKTVGLVQKIRAEAASPVADVFWSGEIFHTIRLARESLLSPYQSEVTAEWPALFVDPLRRWHGFALRARVIAYNTQRISPEQAPKSLEDCLDSRWKGRIVMASPEFGTTGGDVAGWFVHYGPDRAGEILQALKRNDIRLVSGNSTAVRMVAMGQADICFTDTDDVYAAQRNNWPVAMHVLDQNGQGPLAIPNTAVMLAGAPHPNQANVLMDFLLSEQLERMLVQSDSHNCPIRPALVEQYPSYAIPNPLDIDYDKVADLLPEAIKTAREILQ